MSIINSYIDYMRRVGFYNQRMTRKEFWPPFLFNLIAGYLLLDTPILGYLIPYVVLLLSIPPMLQRFNDCAMPKKYILLMLIPFAGWFFVALWLCMKSVPASNDFGPYRA